MLKCKYCTVPISRDTAIMRKHLLNCQSCPDNIKMALQKASEKENQLKRSISNNDNDGNQEEESNENLNRNKKIKIEENKVDEPVCTNDANSKEKISENDNKLEAETSKNEIKSDDIKTENSDDSNDIKSENANKSDDTKSKNSKKSDNLKSENVRSESTKIVSQAEHDSKKKPQKVSEECFISANGKFKVIPAKIKSQTKERILSFLDDPRYQIPQLIEENMEKDFREKIQGNFLQDLEKSLKRPSKLLKNDMIDSQILDDFHEKQNKLKQSRESEQFRSNYLVNRKKNDILNKISEHQVVLISGEPDCGMSTQIAQYILDQEIIRERGSLTSISSVHLRTLSTSTIAEKVASERGEDIGCSVGVFTHSKTIFPRPQGSISFCTTGLLLELIRVDPVLKRFSHIVINDIHERNIESDLILALLKRIIFKRPTLKVILLCTSPYYEDFSKYFNDCCTLELPKKNVTVDEFYLEDVLKFTRFRNFPTAWNRLSNKELSTAVKSNKQYRQFEIEFEEMIRSYTQKLPPKSYPPFVLQELTKFTSEKISFELIVNLVRYISGTKGPGSILIFVPEIMDVIKLHETLGSFFTPEFFKIFSLHSKITNRELNNIFYNTPEGIRKIIIATDIAQTSVTMQDIRYVINCGMKKQYKYNVEQDLETMETEWISQTEAQWRKQHAGRNRPGLCYHLYSKARGETFEQFPKPDILRFQLKKLVLQMKILKIEDLENFSSSFLTTPDPINLKASIAALKEMNALDEHSNLTPLGYHLAFLPLDPVTGKMILLAAMFACIEPVFTIAAKISIKDIFYSDTNEEEILFKKQRLECSHLSDHIFISEALRRFELQSSSLNASIFCEEYSLSFKALDMMSITKKEFSQYLFDMGFLKNKNPSDSYANLNSDNFSLIRAIVCAAFYPNIGIICQSSKKIGRTIVKSASKSKSVKAAGVNVTSVIQGVSYFPIPYLTFNEKKDWINPFGEITTILFDTTVISPLAIFLASTAVDYEQVPGNSVISVSQCLYFVCELETSFIVQKLQEQLALLLKCKITDPEAENWDLLRENLTRAIAVYLSDNNKVTGKVESGFGTCHSLHKIDDKWNHTGTSTDAC